MPHLKLKDFAVDTLYCAAGTMLYALGLYTFAANAGFATGGVSGVSLIINHFTGWPIGVTTLLLNVPLVILCWRVIGKLFLLKSLWTMLFMTLFLDVVFPRLPQYAGNPLLASVFTGLLMGAGLALVYMRGCSTGGTDFLTMSIKKRRPHFSMGQLNLALDAIIILSGGLVFGNIDAVLYGIVATFASTMVMDNILYGAGSGRLAIIVTDHGKQIAAAISSEVSRGSTLIEATGAYTGDKRDMLLCVCGKGEIVRVRNAARAIDPDSMIMISEVSEVLGEGFAPPRLPGSEDPAEGRRRRPPGSGGPPAGVS